MNKIYGVISMLVVLFLMGEGAMASSGAIAFSGSVVTMGCWNETEALELLCHRKDSVARHIIVKNITTSIAEPYALAEAEYLDEDKQLTLLRIVYD